MAKFVIECPQCHNYTMASTFLHRKVDCTCGYTINVATDRMAAKECPHCKNMVVFDQAKGEKALCPVCKEPINTSESMHNAVEISCPSCSCKLNVDKSASGYTCPLCETLIDVQKEYNKQQIKNQGLASVIKYEGGNDVFVWKHPIEDFNLGSQLIVHESQEAIFFRDGQALDLFGAGRYTLATQNLPALEKLFTLPTNADEFFHSEVYFINLTTQMGIKWGTDSKVRLFDPASGLHIELGACGQFNLRVSNSRKFVLKVVGTASGFTQSEVVGEGKSFGVSSAVAHFKALIISKVKTFLARAIKDNDINILEVDSYIDEISAYLKEKINEVLEEYGLVMPEFFVTSVMTPDDDPNFRRLKQQFADKTLKVRQEEVLKAEAEAAQSRKILEAQTEAQLRMVSAQNEAQMKIVAAQGDAEAIKLKGMAEAEAYKAQAMAEAAEMQAKGYTYQQETARQVGLEAMQNGITGGGSGVGGVGSAFGDIASLGVTLGAMGGVINMTKDALNPIMNSASDIGSGVMNGITATDNTWNCSCGKMGIDGNFCTNCGTKKPEPVATTWDCACGKKGIDGNFCSNCGAKKPEVPSTWNCSCGKTDIDGNFCPNCGKERA